MNTYPQYYDVDGTLVVVQKEGEEVAAYVAATKAPYQLNKVLTEGHQITEEEAKKLNPNV